ncbi:MAG: T9SS type A sorting domain-containing protein [Sphingobacteriales bacterium JAD_PAG50586_3]|nr:MAG: T9SS type A sorting domain-containing protein [Sphingobacteriales bacterium JAD_PAG50586_3]
MQLGYNGILYIANSQASALGTITNADTLDNALIYNAAAITVPGTIYNGLPAYNQSYFKRSPIILSVDDDALATLEVYPNPSNGNFRLNVGKNKSKDISLTVYNMTGTKVYSAESFDEGQNVISVDLTKQPAGMYFFDINTPAGKTVKRMVIN